jgi:hypothetical protein
MDISKDAFQVDAETARLAAARNCIATQTFY